MTVSKSNEYDWKKLRLVLIYVDSNVDNKIFILAKSLKYVYRLIYEEFVVNPDTRSHTIGAMYFGTGTEYTNFSK